MTAPGLIWICAHGGTWSPVDGGTQDAKYIRADLHEAEIARLIAERDAALAAERAATIEAAVNAADSAGMSLKPASGWDERDVAWWESGGLDHILAATDAIRALEPQPITVQDAARVLLDSADDIWSPELSTATHDARKAAEKRGHKYRVIDREGWKAALRTIAEQEVR